MSCRCLQPSWVTVLAAGAIGAGSSVALFHGAPSSTDGTIVEVAYQPEGEMDPEMLAWIKSGEVSEHHKALKPMAGTWDVAMTWQMEPGQPATESTGRCVNSWVLGGRFLRHEFSGDFMGMPFEGLGYTGYDNNATEYVGIWMDSFSTLIMDSSGRAIESGRGIEMTGTYDDPAGNKVTNRNVTRIISDDKHVFEMYTKTDKGEFKSATMVYTRTAAARAR